MRYTICIEEDESYKCPMGLKTLILKTKLDADVHLDHNLGKVTRYSGHFDCRILNHKQVQSSLAPRKGTLK